MSQSVIIIGGGIGGLATGCMLAHAGYTVSLYDNNQTLGGRANTFTAHGFTFDTGPSWFLMPEIFEHFFQLFDKDMWSLLDLQKLDPGYKVFYEGSDATISVRGNLEADVATFESIEKGAGKALRRYVKRAEQTYSLATESFLYTNFNSLKPLVKPSVLGAAPAMIRDLSVSIDRYVRRYVHDQRLQQILEYPMVFLGTSPYAAPSLYHLISYLDFKQGVYYPMGGIYRVIEEMTTIAHEQGVSLNTNATVTGITTNDGMATGITLADGSHHTADIVISNGDIYHTESKLLPLEDRSYTDAYWQSRISSPSAILLYLGVKGTLPQLEHHNLFFIDDWKANFSAIFDSQTWPDPASLYICKPSATDPSVAPPGHENLFVLVPIAANDTVSDSDVQAYAKKYLQQIADQIGVADLADRIVYQKVFGPRDFATQYYSYRGSGLGLSHTLRQSALLRTSNMSKKLSNVYYVGGNTQPGIGLPMCLISAELIYKRLVHDRSAGPIKQIERIET